MSTAPNPAHSPCCRADIPPENLVYGCSSAMQEVKRLVERVGKQTTPVLIEGESGTGKETIARLLHNSKGEECGPFLRLVPSHPAVGEPCWLSCVRTSGGDRSANCGNGTPGRGTLYVDELADLDKRPQRVLLTAVEKEDSLLSMDVLDCRSKLRLICATRDINSSTLVKRKLRAGDWAMVISVPPLRHRTEDIPELVDFFVRKYKEQFKSSARPLSDAEIEPLYRYHWPGNIRELENAVRRYVLLDSLPALYADFQSDSKSEHACN